MLILYILFAGKSYKRAKTLKRVLSALQFEVKDQGDLHYLLGVIFYQNYAKKSIMDWSPSIIYCYHFRQFCNRYHLRYSELWFIVVQE